MSLKQLDKLIIKYCWKQSTNPLIEFKFDFIESGSSNSSTTEKLSVSFALNSSCSFDWDKVWFHLMFTFRRLARSPASNSSTMWEKQEESVFQLVVLSSKRALPCSWKLRCSELHFRLNPDVHERRAVDQQKSNTILCELLAALVTVCRSQRRIRCVWSQSP